uniref:Uncharacterized protein n=1 Tax=Octopus bimaculoides TaxID=37653 RepID=A0A0L8GY71_OCTBM
MKIMAVMMMMMMMMTMFDDLKVPTTSQYFHLLDDNLRFRFFNNICYRDHTPIY